MVLFVFAVAACGNNSGSAPGANDDPNKPAVVKAPRVVLPSDTAKPDTMAAHNTKIALIHGKLEIYRANLDAAIAFQDTKWLSTLYAPDAKLTTSDTVFEGSRSIAIGLARMTVARSVRSINHRSSGFSVLDSIVTDSGTYLIVSRRALADSVLERGKYVTAWRMHTEPLNWAIKNDRLTPAGKHKK
jgi:hypothetical protein